MRTEDRKNTRQRVDSEIRFGESIWSEVNIAEEQV